MSPNRCNLLMCLITVRQTELCHRFGRSRFPSRPANTWHSPDTPTLVYSLQAWLSPLASESQSIWCQNSDPWASEWIQSFGPVPVVHPPATWRDRDQPYLAKLAIDVVCKYSVCKSSARTWTASRIRSHPEHPSIKATQGDRSLKKKKFPDFSLISVDFFFGRKTFITVKFIIQY